MFNHGSPYCGRLSPHPEHEWLGRDYIGLPKIARHCPGAPTVEGGNPIHCCDECGLGVRDEDLTPACGAHRLHQWCAPWFSCRQCRNERKGINR